ncbi:MAG: CAP domain-containing protein [Campylobacterota bacterium]|nr:CAP domain-containing protein [Campylobacterota bacterium]
MDYRLSVMGGSFLLMLSMLTGCSSGASNSNESDNNDLQVSSNEGRQSTDTLLSASMKQDYLDAINTIRAVTQDCGEEGIKPAVPALEWSDKIYMAAAEHSCDMATSNTFSHKGSNTSSDKTGKGLGRGSMASERIAHHGYRWLYTGENIAAGANVDTVEEVVQMWLKSPGHCANMMSPDFKDVGMAMIEDGNSDYIHYWTQNFAAPR